MTLSDVLFDLNKKFTMKYSIYCFLYFVFILPACRHSDKEIKEKGPVIVEAIQTASSQGGNLVKSEAPDAITKSEQGYALPKFDDGLAQSPINILSYEVQKNGSKEISINFNIEVTAAENLGHTIQIDFKEGSTTIAAGKTYNAKQFHFHTPSEHLIDGLTYPMEIHIVNILSDSNSGKDPKYLVVGILFKMGRENKFLREFLKAIPGEENKKEILRPGSVNLDDLFNNISKSESGSYYSYKGSLTTPPFTESVDWIIRKYILDASPEQINFIEKMEGDNARHVQALYKRTVLSN